MAVHVYRHTGVLCPGSQAAKAHPSAEGPHPSCGCLAPLPVLVARGGHVPPQLQSWSPSLHLLSIKGGLCCHNLIWIHLEDARYYSGNAEWCCFLKEHVLKKKKQQSFTQSKYMVLKWKSKYWEINGFTLAAVTNTHSNKTSLFVHYRPTSWAGHMG